MLRVLIAAFLLTTPAAAQEAEPQMSFARLGEIVMALDPAAQRQGQAFRMQIDGTEILIVADPAADRMRAMVHIRPIDGISPTELARMMQANFDTALDARYALAKEALWAVFIHPLSPLEKDQLISGLGQTANLARTYGTLYTGGALEFGGGDSQGIQQQFIEELLRKGQDI